MATGTAVYNGALIKGTTLVAQPTYGGALSLNGSSQSLRLPALTMSPTYSGFTFSCWFNSPAPPRQWARIFDMSQGLKSGDTDVNGASQPNISTYVLALNSDGTLTICGGMHPNGAGWNFYRTTANVCDGNWHHVAWVMNSTSWKLLVDGIDVSPANITSTAFIPPANNTITLQNGTPVTNYRLVYVGNSSWTGDPFPTMMMSGIRLYSRGITPAEVSALVAAKL